MNADPADTTIAVPTTSTPTPPLDSLQGRYELGDIIGEGGMGVVRRALDRSIDRHVAIKLLKPGVAADSPTAARFFGEAKLTGQLQHPGIPPVHDLGTLADGRPFLAMKLVKGRTLRELLRDRSGPDADPGRHIAIFEQVCHAVGYAHAHRVIHRDLKSVNIMVGAHGEVQVMDWGLAKVLDDAATADRTDDDRHPIDTVRQQTEIGTREEEGSATRTGSVLGTPAYMSPEQAGGEVRRLDARSDVFGLGAILCEMLTGMGPYEGSDAHGVLLKAIRGDQAEARARLDACGADPDLIALCKWCMAHRQEDRPDDGHAVALAVAEHRQQAEARARQAELDRARALVSAVEQAKRRRLLLTAGGMIVTVLLAGFAACLWQMNRANRERNTARIAEAKAERDREAAAAAEDKAEKSFQAALTAFKNQHSILSSLLGENHVDTLTALENLAATLAGNGDHDDAEPLLRDVLKRRETLLGPQHPQTQASRQRLNETLAVQGKPPVP